MTVKRIQANRPLDIHWSDRAKDDLAAIGDYIAAGNLAAAIRWIERLMADVERTAAVPRAGRVVPEYSDRPDICEVGNDVLQPLATTLPDHHAADGPANTAWAQR